MVTNTRLFSVGSPSAVQGVVVAAEPLPASFAALQANVQRHRNWCLNRGVPCGTIEALNTGVADGSSTVATFTLYERAAGGLTRRDGFCAWLLN